jgi:hypothetical protein
MMIAFKYKNMREERRANEKKTLKKLVKLRKLIYSDIIINKYKIGARSFTRKGKMSFQDLILFMMNMVNKTLQREINDYIKNIKREKIKYQKSSMSKARMKISPELFKELNRELIKDIYEDKEEIKLFKNFRIFAVDGTRLELPNMYIPKDVKQSEDIKTIYGQGSNQHDKYAITSRTSTLYDVENKIIIDGIFNSIYASESYMAIEHINYLVNFNKEVKAKYLDLITYDRGYPSVGLICHHYNKKIDFLMRVKNRSFKAVTQFKNSKKTDEIIELEVTKDTLYNLQKDKQHPDLKQLAKELKLGQKIKIRAIKVILKSGEVEVLLTSLLSQEEYKTEIFKDLYFKRWGIEISYDILKNIFKVENFTGLTQIAINQDFLAIILTNNISSLIMDDIMEEKVTLYNAEKERKYLYQLNKNFSIGTMKDKLVYMLVQNTNVSKIYKMIEDEIMSNLLPIKPDRSFERKKKFNTKHPVAKKAGY